MKESIRIAQVLNRIDSGGIEAIVIDYYRYLDHGKAQYDCAEKRSVSFERRMYPIQDYDKLL